MSTVTPTLKDAGLTLGANRHPRLDAFKKNPIADAVLSKLVKARNTGNGFQPRTVGGIDHPDGGWLSYISNKTSTSVNDSSSLYQLLPDTELAQQILVSSILSPKDMVSTELNFNLVEGVVEGEVAGALLRVVEDYFERVYKIQPLLSDMLREILFTKGSYPLLVLPESSIDDAINSPRRVSLESLRGELVDGNIPKSIGILGPATKVTTVASLESFIHGDTSGALPDTACVVKPTGFNADLHLTVSDNLSILKMPHLMDKLRQDRLQDKLTSRSIGLESRKASMEADGSMTVRQLEQSLYKPRHNAHVPVRAILTADQVEKDTVGHPLVMKLPPECVIPVHTPGNPEDHLGYFLLLDQNGHFLNTASQANHYSDLAYNLGSSQELTSQLINTVRQGTEGRNVDSGKLNVDNATLLYAQLVETDLLNRARNGLNGEAVEIARPLDVYRIMLARTLANEQTQVLYVPAELVTYMAFSFNDFGVGKSLLEDNKILASLRAMLMFANTMQAVHSSVGHTSVKIELDPVDPDPSTTVEFLMHEYAKNRQSAYPLGASSPRDIVNFLQNAGVDLQVSGNPGYPETKMSVESAQRDYGAPNTDLEESLKKRYLMSLGLSPEAVDATANVEFATSIVAGNLLLSKRVIVYQDKFTALLENFVRTYTLNSGALMNSLRKTLENNHSQIRQGDKEVDVEVFLRRFISAVQISLPRPDTVTLENQKKAFDTYNESLEAMLAAYLDASFFDSTSLGDGTLDLEVFKSAVKAHFQVRWLRENNVMPELMDLTTFTKDDHPITNFAEVYGNRVESLSAVLEGLAEKIALNQKARDARKEAFEKEHEVEIGGGGGGMDSSAGDGTDEGGGDDEFGGGDDGFGDDDLGGDDAGGGEEEPAAEEPEETEEAPETEETDEPEAAEDEPKPDTESLPNNGAPIIQPE